MDVMKKILAQIFVLLLASTTAFAATQVTRYINTDCANNGDGTASTCAASAGAAGAYNGATNSITDVCGDYPSGFIAADVNVTIDARGATEDTLSGDIGCSPTGSDATRKLRFYVAPANRHDGKWNTSKYRIKQTSGDVVIYAYENFLVIEGVQVWNSDTVGQGYGILPSDSPNNLVIKDCIIRGASVAGSAGILINAPDNSGSYYLINNIIYDFDNGISIGNSGTSGTSFYVYNNTVANVGGTCIEPTAYGTTDKLVMKNNVMQDCTGNDYYTEDPWSTYTHSNNITEDATSPDVSFRSKSVVFANQASDDYHLGASDVEAKDLGTDLSADADYPFSTDIDNQTRSGSWDIGADEIVSASSTSIIPLLTEIWGY